MVDKLLLDPRTTALVVIDLQKGIVQRSGDPHSTASVVANSVRLLQAVRAAGGQPVLVHVGRSADGGDGLQPVSDEPMRGGSMRPGWSELVAELDRQPNDLVILKRQWGAFYGTELDLQLRRRGLKTIILCGVATEIGVESTARDAYERGYQLVFAEDAMTGLNGASHTNTVTRIFPRIGRVRSTDEIVAALGAQ